jgi:hypothetical protein
MKRVLLMDARTILMGGGKNWWQKKESPECFFIYSEKYVKRPFLPLCNVIFLVGEIANEILRFW